MLLEIIKFILLVSGVLLLGKFAGSEIALLSLSPIDLQKVKSKKTIEITYWQDYTEKFFSSLIAWINILCIAIGVISTSLALDLVNRYKKDIWLFWIPTLATLATLFFGEIFPKIEGRKNPYRFLEKSITLIYKLSKFLEPFVDIFTTISKSILSLIFGKIEMNPPALTSEDLKSIINEEKKITKGQKEIITNILEFGEQKLTSIMTPKSNIFAIDIDIGIEHLLKQIKNVKYSRIPIYRKNIDNIIGILFIKDLLRVLYSPWLFSIKDIIRPAHFVPETAKIDNLLRDFKTGKHHMTIVVDEYGTLQGVVTVEDVIEELFGEIYDEYDTFRKTIVQVGENSWIVNGDETIQKTEEFLDILIKTDAVTIAGLVLTIAHRIPKIGEIFNYNDLILEVIDADEKKINKIKIIKKK